MNTFMLLVCLPPGSTQPADLHTQLAARLARFDRNRRVAPYRSDADFSPAMLDQVLRVLHRSRTLDEVDLDDQSQLWAAILAAHNSDLDDESDRLYLDPDGTPYQLRTTNPHGRFGRWAIGGRWRARFIAAPDVRPAQLIHPQRAGDRWRCAGGPLHALDLAGMRADAAIAAHAAYDRWEEAVADTAPATPWQVFADRHHADPDRYPYTAALADFHHQPRLQALRHHDAHAGSAPRFASIETANMYADVVDAYQAGRDVYVTYRARMAVLGYALLTTDEQWLAPGQQPRGPWPVVAFADQLAYTDKATAHLGGLDPRTLLVGLTCHT